MKYFFVLLIILSILLPSGCAKEEEKMMVPCPNLDDTFLDVEQLHIPTEEQMKEIQGGTFFYDAVKIIGKPHGYMELQTSGTKSMITTFYWTTTAGNTYSIQFLPQEELENASNMTLNEFHQYTVAVSEARIFELDKFLDNPNITVTPVPTG